MKHLPLPPPPPSLPRNSSATARRPMTALAVVLIVAGVAAGGCQQKKPVERVGPVPVGSMAQQWKFDLELDRNKDAIRGLYLRGDTLYAYSQRNLVSAFQASSGRPLYSTYVKRDSNPLKPPIPVKDRVGIPAGSTIEVYDASGNLLESVDAKRSIRSPGVAFENTIYIGLDYPQGGRLAALDLTRRFDRARWELMTPESGISAAPAIANNVIFVASEDGKVRAINLDRTPAWPLENSTFQTGGRVHADLRADEQCLYIAATDSKLYALDRGSGRIRWQYHTGAPLRDAPVVTATMIYQIVPGTGVAALDKADTSFNRQPKWVARGAKRFLSEGERHVFVLDRDNRIAALDKTTGDVQFKSKRNDLRAFAVNPTGATIYAATEDGVIMSVEPVTKPGAVGTIVWAPVEPRDALATAGQ